MAVRAWFLALGLVCLAWCAACEERGSTPPPLQIPVTASASAAEHSALTAVPGDAVRGEALVQRFECNRCHEGTGYAPAPLTKHCFSCHEQIMSGTFPVSATALARFRPHVASAREAPSLTAIADRLQPAWIRSYLLAPHDLRPGLTPTMPRLALDAAQAADIVAYLIRSAMPASPVQAIGDASRGREVMEQKGCSSCHAFSGVPAFTSSEPPPPGTDAARAAALAPDLSYTRERFRPEQLVRWLVDPKGMKSDTRMPSFGLTNDEAADIAAYVSRAPLAPRAATPFTRLPPLARRVSFDEVNRQVFSRTCHHCHTDPESSGGDGGPGNTGGFGFEPRGVSFSSHASILSGYLDARGQRRSLFEPLADGTPRLVAALLARHDEAALAPRDAVRGMPLGLPALSAADIQLVESWVAQGKPL